MIETFRKCHECKNTMVLERDDFVIEKDEYYHAECLVKHYLGMKRKKKTEEEARKIVDNLRVESKLKVKEIIQKNHLFKWLQNQYDIVTIPSYIFTKFDAIFNGTYKGMSREIPPEDLLDMWQRRWNDLVSLHYYNSSKGKLVEPVDQLNYDIAVILAKTTSYYNWKSQQKTKEQEIKELQSSKKIDYEKIYVEKKTVNSENYIIEDEEEEND